MDKLEALKKNAELLKKLIEQTEDEQTAKAYSEQYDECLREIAREEAREEQKTEIKALKDEIAAMKSSQAKIFDVIEAGTITVGAGKTESYKGFNLNREVKLAGMRAIKHQGIINRRFAADPELAMNLSKMFIDKYVEASRKSPLEIARAKAAMQEGTDPEGGYLTPTEQRFELVAYAREASIALQRATHISMTSDVMTIPTELTKVSVAVTAEEAQATETEPTFDQVTLTAKRYDGYGKTSNELLEDAAVNGGIVGLLLDQFIEATGKAIDSVVFTAPGDPASGIFSAKAGASVVFDSGSTAFSEIIEADLREAIRKVKKEYRDGAVWMMHDELLWDYIRGLKDSN